MDKNKDWLSHKIGTYLKDLRNQTGLSQGDVANKLGYHSNQFISNVERGVCTPSPSIIHNFLEVYGVSNSKAVQDILNIQLKYLEAEYKGKKLKLN
jgi:transcriptional regulator with XRE-family HTH domain